MLQLHSAPTREFDIPLANARAPRCAPLQSISNRPPLSSRCDLGRHPVFADRRLLDRATPPMRRHPEMKRLTAATGAGLAAIALSLALVGCGSDSKTESTTSSKT